MNSSQHGEKPMSQQQRPCNPSKSAKNQRPTPEVNPKPVRRKHSAQYKLRILEQTDNCQPPLSIGQILRREGLYASHLALWRKQRQQGTLKSLQAKKTGRKVTPISPLIEENEQLRREVENLKRELHKASTIIEVQKKISELFGIETKAPEIRENKL